MYETFFGFSESPFSIAPDPRYLYMSERHQEALAHLLFGLEREGGFILLTGEVGTGKTTICRKFLENVPENTELAFVLYPKLSAMELLATICEELGIHCPAEATTKCLVDLINKHLLAAHAQGRHTALVIDEAQNLTTDVLEQLRLLTNLETDKKKLLQIILLGQPELNNLLSRQELRQLSQRVTARYHLEPLSAPEVEAYITFRLSVAGCRRNMFGKADTRRIHNASRGIPRLINLICDRALLGAYSQGEQDIKTVVVKQAVKEVLGQISAGKNNKMPVKAIGAGLTFILLGFVVSYFVLPAKYIDNLVNNVVLFVNHESRSHLERSPAEPDSFGIANSPVADKTSDLSDSPSTSPDARLNHDIESIRHRPLHESSNYGPFEDYQPQKTNISTAYGSLFRQWRLTDVASFANEAEHCNWAAQRGLECLHRSGNWRSLLQLNRPAILTLMNQQGVRFRVTLIDMSTDDIATLELDGEQHRINLSTLDRYWYGQYSLLWKVPPYKSMVIGPGAIQDRVEWLETQLDLRDTLLAKNYSQKKPAKLQQRVKEFQQEVGIEPDGIAGTITIIMLNSWTKPETPLLLARDKTKVVARDSSQSL